MSASRMPWEIPGDVRSHAWDSDRAGAGCVRCGKTWLDAAFFGGACTSPTDPSPVVTPPACGCSCHIMPGVMHVAACCNLSAADQQSTERESEALETAAEMGVAETGQPMRYPLKDAARALLAAIGETGERTMGTTTWRDAKARAKTQTERDWAEKITKVAIERRDDETHPWSLWGRDYETGLVTEEVEDYPTFAEAVAAIPAFFERYAPTTEEESMKTPEQIVDEEADSYAELLDESGEAAFRDSLNTWRQFAINAIKADRAQRPTLDEDARRITTHDSRCTLGPYHDGECNVKDWRG